jgi:large subunit ribosomal protein L4
MAEKKVAEKKEKAPRKAAAAKPRAKAAKTAKASKAVELAPEDAPTPAAGVTAAPVDRSVVEVVNAENEKVRDKQLSPEVFAVKVNEHLLYEAVKQYRAGGRAGTHMTKNRALVSGSGRKPWRQKGTGRARVGETRNPLWRHGGTVFGPVPRDYSYSLPRKARAAALRSALSQRVSEGALKVVEGFPVDVPRTKQLRGILDKLGVAGKKTVLVDHEPPDALVLSGRNIPWLKVVSDSHLNVVDVLDCRHLVVSQQALDKLEERLTP